MSLGVHILKSSFMMNFTKHAHICINLMIFPYRKSTMDKQIIHEFKHANIEHGSINEYDHTRYINLLFNTTAYSFNIHIINRSTHDDPI